MVLITVALVVVQEMCSRLGAYTGEGLGALIREQFPLRSGAAAMVLLFVANAGLTVSEFAGVGRLDGAVRRLALHRGAGRVAAIWAVTVLGNYSRAERVFLVMGLVFIAYPIAAVLAPPALGHGRQQPRVAAFPAHEGIPAARGRADRNDDHALHAVLHRVRRRRQGSHTRRPTESSGSTPSTARSSRRRFDLHHHRHRRGDRRHRPAELGQSSRRGAAPGGGRSRVTAVRRSGCSAPRCSPRRWCHSRARTRSPRRQESSARCRASSARRPSSTGSSRCSW